MVTEVIVDEGLYNGQQVPVGLISEGYRCQATKQGKPITCSVYDERFANYMVELLKQHVVRKFDNRILMTGPPGSGKSTEAITLARLIDRDFPVESVTFRLSDFRKKLAELPEAVPSEGWYPAAVLDESGVDLYSKDWAKTHTKEMSKVFQIIRKKKLTMIMCLPHRDLLTKDIRDAMHWWFDMKTIQQYRGFAVVREAKHSEWSPPWWRPMGAYIFDELDDDFWKTYEERKDLFIEEFTAEAPQTSNARTQKLMEQRDACIKVLRKNKVSVREIERITGLDDGRISRIANGRP